jgi:hypothetical protein
MEIKNSRVVCLSAFIAALATGCAVSVAPPAVYVPPPEAVVTVGGPEAVVTVGVPDAYVWDGIEFVGVVGGSYMYLGPGETWVVCDSVRLERFHGWERGHPDWRRTAVRNVGPNARGIARARKGETPARKVEAPARKVEAPAQKAQAPARKAPAPAQKAQTPARKAPAPARTEEKKDQPK